MNADDKPSISTPAFIGDIFIFGVILGFIFPPFLFFFFFVFFFCGACYYGFVACYDFREKLRARRLRRHPPQRVELQEDIEPPAPFTRRERLQNQVERLEEEVAHYHKILSQV